jgi:hypothetical protein
MDGHSPHAKKLCVFPLMHPYFNGETYQESIVFCYFVKTAACYFSTQAYGGTCS